MPSPRFHEIAPHGPRVAGTGRVAGRGRPSQAQGHPATGRGRGRGRGHGITSTGSRARGGPGPAGPQDQGSGPRNPEHGALGLRDPEASGLWVSGAQNREPGPGRPGTVTRNGYVARGRAQPRASLAPATRPGTRKAHALRVFGGSKFRGFGDSGDRGSGSSELGARGPGFTPPREHEAHTFGTMSTKQAARNRGPKQGARRRGTNLSAALRRRPSASSCGSLRRPHLNGPPRRRRGR